MAPWSSAPPLGAGGDGSRHPVCLMRAWCPRPSKCPRGVDVPAAATLASAYRPPAWSPGVNRAAWLPGGVLYGLCALWRGSGLLNVQDERSAALPQPSPLLSGSARGTLPVPGVTAALGPGRGRLRVAQRPLGRPLGCCPRSVLTSRWRSAVWTDHAYRSSWTCGCFALWDYYRYC